jgi:protein TonB
MQAAEPLHRRTALTASNIPGTRYSVAFAQTSAASHSIASGLEAPAVNDAAATPAAPETTLAAKLIKRVDPVYPMLARNSGISGGVVLNAHIDEAGKVQDVRAISGNPGLVDAAVEAVRQWQYQPSFVNGQPRQSDARIVINFSLR